ncbi:MAG: hypothetical protein NC930_05350, partial [Candidatus Omnitrophica bacterium]|nr:hypothetical protein [Candidatus Omnitrophota bacterium]
SGEILGWLNSDDMLAPNALAFIACCLGDGGSDSWVIGAAQILDAEGKHHFIRYPGTDLSRTAILHWHKNWFPQPSTFWTRTLWEKAGPLDENLHFASDYDLWLRMRSYAEPIVTRRVLSLCRFHEQAKGFKHRFEVAQDIIRVFKKETRHQERVRFFYFILEVGLKYIWDCFAAFVKNISARLFPR